jgi:hypothetical protein
MHPTEEETTAEAPLCQEARDFAGFCALLASEMKMRARSLGQLANAALEEPCAATMANLLDYMFIFQQFGQRIGMLKEVVVHATESTKTTPRLQASIRNMWDREVGYPPGKHCVMSEDLERLWKRQHLYVNTLFLGGGSNDPMLALMALVMAGNRS